MKEKIKELFKMLSRADQLELLRELNSSITNDNPVVRLNELCQTLYGENLRFGISNVGDQLNPVIKAELTTPWGFFEAFGQNQRLAKTKAAEVALEAVKKISQDSFFEI